MEEELEPIPNPLELIGMIFKGIFGLVLWIVMIYVILMIIASFIFIAISPILIYLWILGVIP